MNDIKKIKQIINSMVANSPIGAMKISSTILLRKIEKIEKECEQENKIENAEQQFTGFAQGYYFSNIIGLVESMGLEKREWNYLKNKEMVNCLEDNEIKEIEEYFKK